ncbi:MAG: hypothetical protein MMC33_000866 [Icmadophila ericetorum]|nr:hypothetical protein [Icmadophila ericetorum]
MSYGVRVLGSLRLAAGRVRQCPRSSASARKSSTTRQWSTPLARNIAETTGPISIAAYMRQCLTSPDGGYYTTKNQDRDQFGQTGDFTTSPEISQVFGELIGIWLVAEWIAQGRKSGGVEIVEVGPGRGTLMDDVLRTLRNFRPFASSIESVCLVETSPSLREAQKKLLCGDESMIEIENGFQSKSKYAGLPVTWYEDIRFVPNNATNTPFILAHEFFDALPINAFQSVAPLSNESSTIQGLNGPIELSNPTLASKTPQWRELVVTPNPPPSTITTSSRPNLSYPAKPAPEFQLSLSKSSTPSSLVLPEASPRYQALKSKPGSIIEISPESQSYAAEFARRIGGGALSPQSSNPASKSKPSGAALIIDYGPSNTIPTSTLRGIRAHQFVSPFTSPGRVDLSADVDFTALAEAAINASPGVEVHGPVEQGLWLERMGVKERVEMLVGKVGEGEGGMEATERLRKGVERLVERGGGGMGRLYKIMAILPENGGRKRPVGFGGGADV